MHTHTPELHGHECTRTHVESLGGGGEGAPALGQLPGEQKEEKERLQTLAPCVPLILTVGRHRQDLELSTHWLLLPLPPGKQWAW